MTYPDDMSFALALYDALTPEDRSAVMEILRDLSSRQSQSDADQETDKKKDQ